jgi:protocatechuate 3,4-dioxygenase beta subunit
VKRILALGALVAALVAPSAVARPAASCTATPPDGFGPFGRGIPPMRAKIGKGGHVLTGIVVSAVSCSPLKGAQVQYWQADKNGRYTRAGSGTVLTDRNGRFRFETPIPPRYDGLPPHIHLRVVAKDHVPLLARYQLSPGEKRGSVELVLRPIDL